jgi:hypothetical protein
MIQRSDSLPADYAMPLRLRFLDEMPLEPHRRVYGSSAVDREVENSSRQETVAG